MPNITTVQFEENELSWSGTSNRRSLRKSAQQWGALLLIDRDGHLAPPPLVGFLMMHEQAGDTKWEGRVGFPDN